MVNLFVAVEPKPKGNKQRIVRKGRHGPLRVVNDKSVIAKQTSLVHALWTHRDALRETLRGAVEVGVTFVLPIPGSWPAWKQEAAHRRLVFPYTDSAGSSGAIPDRGNLLKLLEDALEKAGYLANDSQIVGGPVAKVYGRVPGYELSISAKDEVTSFAEWKAYLESEELGAERLALAKLAEH